MEELENQDMEELLGVLVESNTQSTKSCIPQVIADVQLMLVYIRCEETVTSTLHGGQRLQRRLMVIDETGWKGVQNFVVQVPLVVSPQLALHSGEHQVLY